MVPVARNLACGGVQDAACAAQYKKKATSPLTPGGLPRSRPGDAPREGTGAPLRPQGCCVPLRGGLRSAMTPGDHGGPLRQEAPAGTRLLCPGTSRPTELAAAHKRTRGTSDELAFDSQKRNRNYKVRYSNPID
jgi:hypothetical protein